MGSMSRAGQISFYGISSSLQGKEQHTNVYERRLNLDSGELSESQRREDLSHIHLIESEPVRKIAGNLINAIVNTAQRQSEQRPQLGYTLPALVGSMPSRDAIINATRSGLAQRTVKSSVEIRLGNYSAHKGEIEKQNCPFPDIAFYSEGYKKNDPKAKRIMFEYALELGGIIANSYRERNLVGEIPQFVKMREPAWLSHFNHAELKEIIRIAINQNLGLANTHQIDIKFPEDAKSSQYENVIGPIMRENIIKALNSR